MGRRSASDLSVALSIRDRHAPRLPPDVPLASATITTFVMPHMQNVLGDLFGGELMALVDQAAAVAAIRHAGGPAVTASIDRVDFRERIPVGLAGDLRRDGGLRGQQLDGHHGRGVRRAGEHRRAAAHPHGARGLRRDRRAREAQAGAAARARDRRRSGRATPGAEAHRRRSGRRDRRGRSRWC